MASTSAIDHSIAIIAIPTILASVARKQPYCECDGLFPLLILGDRQCDASGHSPAHHYPFDADLSQRQVVPGRRQHFHVVLANPFFTVIVTSDVGQCVGEASYLPVFPRFLIFAPELSSGSSPLTLELFSPAVSPSASSFSSFFYGLPFRLSSLGHVSV
jgi:hypothetical protein